MMGMGVAIWLGNLAFAGADASKKKDRLTAAEQRDLEALYAGTLVVIADCSADLNRVVGNSAARAIWANPATQTVTASSSRPNFENARTALHAFTQCQNALFNHEQYSGCPRIFAYEGRHEEFIFAHLSELQNEYVDLNSIDRKCRDAPQQRQLDAERHGKRNASLAAAYSLTSAATVIGVILFAVSIQIGKDEDAKLPVDRSTDKWHESRNLFITGTTLWVAGGLGVIATGIYQGLTKNSSGSGGATLSAVSLSPVLGSAGGGIVVSGRF